MPIRAFLYDATAADHEVALTPQVVADLHDQQLLWVDVTALEDADIHQVATRFALTRESLYTLLQKEHRPRLDNYGEYSQLNMG